MNILTADISSGNIGQDTRNDIAWRRDWVKRLQETETYFANSIKEPQPFYIVYSTDIRQGKVDYQKETTDLTIWMGFYPDFVWAENINEVINAVRRGLQTTGRAQVWELDWPAKSINNPSPFVTQTKNSTSSVVVEIINNEGKSIGKQTVKSPYGFESRSAVITPLWQWEGDVVFTAVNANLITDKLTIKITSIDGIAAENASKQKNISVMPLTEWESLLKMLPSTRQNIELVRQRQREQEAAAQRQREQEAAAARQREQEAATAAEAKVKYDQGNKNYNAGNYNQAITDYTEALRLDSKYETAITYYNRGYAYYYTSNYYQAIADFTQAIRLDTNYARAYFWRAEAYFKIRNYTMAIDDYTQVIRIEPKNTLAYNNRGASYYNISEYTRAIADLSESIRLNPNGAYAYNLRGKAYYYLNRKNSYSPNQWYAERDLEAAVKLEPSNTDYRNDLIKIRGN